MRWRAQRTAKVWGVAIVALAAIGAGCSDNSSSDSSPLDGGGDGGSESAKAPSEGDVIIGVIADTSGPAAQVSTVTQEGIDLAVEEINEDGGIDGTPVALMLDNDAGDATQTAALVRKQAAAGAETILFTTSSASILGVKAVCEELKVVCISPTSPSPAIPAAPNNTYAFGVAPGIDKTATALAESMPKDGVKTVAFLEDNNPTVIGIDDALIKAMEENGLDIVAREAVAPTANDASAEVARIAAAKPDAVLISSLGGQPEITMTNAMFQQLPDLPKFGKQSLPNQPSIWSLADPGALEGIVYAQTIDMTNPRTEELAKKIEERLGGDFIAMSDYYAQGYDAVYLVRMAYEGSAPGERLKGFESIEGYEPHFGQDGLTLSFTSEKHSAPDDLCAIVMLEFGADNQPAGPWSVFQPTC